MSDFDDEILSDFLVESGEILDRLGGQLVELEQAPDDADLLNAVFRGFHTIKGGAGFLNLDPLVEICHVSEDVFNALRQGELTLSADIMDLVLKVVDVLQDQYALLNKGESPQAADPALIHKLAVCLASGESETPPDAGTATQSAKAARLAADADVSDVAFEAILKTLDADAGSSPPGGAGPSPQADDEISDDEFEKLLDDLHGSGAPKKVSGGADPVADETKAVAAAAQGANKTPAADLITDDEFEQLLDTLHGAGKPRAVGGPGMTSQQVAQHSVRRVPLPKQEPPARRGKAGTKRSQSDSMIRVDTRQLDQIMNMVGELVLVRNRLDLLQRNLHNEDVARSVGNLDLVTSDLQSAVMQTRMQPLKKVFGRFPRVVRDLARHLDKQVDLVLEGEDTGLDKTLVDALADPMVHLVRNAVDHGIESPQQRQAAGKSPTGIVRLSAEQEGDHILISISDDGNGMDPEKLRAIAVDKGLLDADAAARLTDKQAFDLIFMAGFSTAVTVSDVSGRGVGMDVVKSSIQALNASIEIQSVQGEGTTLIIRVPLTLAILPTLMVALKGQRFAFPLDSVQEILHLDHAATRMVDDQEVMMVRGEAMPLFFLARWLVPGSSANEIPVQAEVVTVNVAGQRVGFVVDTLVGQEEVVIKPLGPFVSKLESFAGATIGDDGGIALIVDVTGMIRTYASRFVR